MKPIHVKLFSQDASSGFIYNLFPGFFIMFKQKVIDSSRVICISAFNVFYDCHSYHLPVSVLLWCHSPPSFLIRHPGYAITLFNRLSLPVIVI